MIAIEQGGREARGPRLAKEGVMMCRVTAPLSTWFRREGTSRPPLPRRLRIARHRTLRWFNQPIASIERERRERDPGPSVWLYYFRPWPLLRVVQPLRARRRA